MENTSSLKLRRIFIFFLISLLFKPIWLFNNQDLGKPGNDDLSHWLHSATLVYDFDIKYENDYEVELGTFNYETNTPYHPPGAGYLSAPFVLLFSIFDSEEPQRLNPVGSFAYVGFFAASLFYFWMGLYLILKVLIKKNIEFNYLILFSVLVGTLAHFVTTRFMMSHAVEFFLCSYLCYLFEKTRNPYSLYNFGTISLVYLLLSLTRPSTFIYSLCLILIYAKKKDLNLKNLYIAGSSLILTITIHIFISLYLYKTYTIFENYQTNFDEQGYMEFDLFFIIKNTPKIFNLIFSPSMGMIWVLPVVVFGILSIILNTNKEKNYYFVSKVFTFLYFYGAFIVLIVWQGREVAYGQRLLIGLIPFCAIKLAEFVGNKNFQFTFNFFTWISYIGYMYFYTSDNLNLKFGKTLWGTEVGFAGENYFIYLFRELLSIENIVSLLGRTIYSVNLFSFIKFENFISLFRIEKLLPFEKLSKVASLTDIYSSTDRAYLISINFLIIIFCFLVTKTILSGKEKTY